VCACAGVAFACALVLGTLVTLNHLLKDNVIVVLGEGTTVSTAVQTSTTSKRLTVSAGNLTSAWAMLAEVVGFDAKTAHADQLTIDYTAAGGIERLEITAQTEVGEVIVQTEGRSPWGESVEFTATVSDAGAASETSGESPVISVLSALDVVDVRVLIAKFGSKYPLYRLTTAGHVEDEPKATYLWREGKPASSALTLIADGANLPEDEASAYVRLDMTACASETDARSSTTLLHPIVMLEFVLPIVADPDKLLKEGTVSVDAAAESLRSVTSLGDASAKSGTHSASEGSSSAGETEADPEPSISP
jgi:hypothetical protein